MSYKIDVVILSWNRLDDTIAAIESCLSQIAVDMHVYVVDQGSDFEVIENIKNKYTTNERVIFKCLGKNVGVAEGRNIGYFLGSAPYIFSLDNDAKLIESDTLFSAVEKMELEKNISVLSFRIINYTNEKDGQSRSFATVYDDCLDKEFESVRFAGGAHVIRRTTFVDVGGYDSELFFGGEEEELSRKIINLGETIRYVPSFYVMHRSTSEGRVGWRGERFYYLVRNRLYIRMKFSDRLFEVPIYALGYLVKGLLNLVFFQAIKGVKDSIILFLKFKKKSLDPRLYKSNTIAKQYMNRNEENLRGSFFQRIRKEVLVKLPKF